MVAQPDVAGRAGRLVEQPGDVERGHGRGAAWAFSSGRPRSAPRSELAPSSSARAVALVEHVDAALDAGQRLDALALEPDEHAGGVLVGAASDLARLVLGPLDDLRRALLGRAHELALLEHLRGLLLGAGDDRVAFLAGALGDAAGLLGDAARLAHLVGHRDAQLVDELEHGRLVEHDVVRERQLLAGRDQRLQSLDEEDDVRGRALLGRDYTRGSARNRSASASATGPGPSASTSPPNRATSFASDELT